METLRPRPIPAPAPCPLPPPPASLALLCPLRAEWGGSKVEEAEAVLPGGQEVEYVRIK